MDGSFEGQVSHKNLSGRVTTTETKPVFLATCRWWQQGSLVLVWMVLRGQTQGLPLPEIPLGGSSSAEWRNGILALGQPLQRLSHLFPQGHLPTACLFQSPKPLLFPSSHPCPSSFGEAGCLRATSSVQQPDHPSHSHVLE